MLEAITGIDWAAAAQALVVTTGFYCPWLLMRNYVLGQMIARLFQEEVEWCKQHEDLFRGRLKRLDSLPPYHHMLFSMWIPLADYEAQLKPIPEYYKEHDNGTVQEERN